MTPRIVHTAHPGPMAAVYVWFNAGTVDEREGEHGAAHLLEHMLFKGTRSHGVGESAAAIEALGGDLNAYTVWDQTVLHATVLAEHWREALHVLSEMAWHATMDPDELEREKQVVVEEIRGYANDPQSVLDDALTEALFPEHPYGRPVLGTEESVRAIDHATLVGFWRRNYGAGRCVVGAAGPMTKAELVEAVEALPIPSDQPRIEVPALPEVPRDMAHVEGDFDTPFVALGYPTVGGEHPDVPVLEVLAQVLGGGRASILQRRLRFELELVNDIWATTFARRQGGTLEIGFVPAAGKTEEALQAVLDVLAEVRDGIDSVDADRGRKSLLADRAYSQETVDAIAHDLVWFTARHGDPEGRDAYDRQVALVDANTLSRVAREVLVDPVIRLLDDDAKPELTTRETAPATLTGILVSGAADGWQAQGEILSVYLGMPGGRLAEPPRRAGLADAWSAMVTNGAGPLDAVALAGELESIGGSIRAINGRNTLGLRLTVPSVDARRGLELLQLVVQQPRFDATEWARVENEYRFELDTLDDRPEEVMGRRLAQLCFPDHPWGRVLTRTSLGRIHPRALRTFHQQSLARGVRVGVAGRCTPRLLEPLVTEPHPLQHVELPLGPMKTGRFESRAGVEQALHVLAFRTPPIGHAHQPAIAVAVGLLSAQAGRLFLELREKRSLAYSVWAHKRDGLASGLLTVGLATDPGRLAEARRALRETFAALVEDGPTAAELERTVGMLIGQFASAHQSASARATHLALAQLYGHPPGLAPHEARLRAVTSEQVRDVLQALPEGLELTVRP